jgi:dipeptidyl aminopeptidase/acylaminoacyl peptidase
MSSGAHLALLAGMGAELPGEAGAGAERAAASPAAAIVSWFGISDVADLLRGHRPRRYARRWVGEGAAALSLARALSPVEFVTAKTPPVVSVHGTLDPTVPYEQSARLHEALERCGVRHRLFTVPEGGHGDFAEEVWAEAYACVFEFLRVNVL